MDSLEKNSNNQIVISRDGLKPVVIPDNYQVALPDSYHMPDEPCYMEHSYKDCFGNETTVKAYGASACRAASMVESAAIAAGVVAGSIILGACIKR